MIYFKTTKERHVDAVVLAVNELYDGTPLVSKEIGKQCGMDYRMALTYLNMAKKAGRVNPVLVRAGGPIGGWVPATVDASMPLDERRARHLAKALREAYSGKPLSISAVSRHMGEPAETVKRWIWRAESFGLVRETNSGWEPV